MKLVLVGATLATFGAMGSAAPRDESQTEVQSDAVNKSDAVDVLRVEEYLELRRVFLSSSRQCCIHGGFVLKDCRTGRNEEPLERGETGCGMPRRSTPREGG